MSDSQQHQRNIARFVVETPAARIPDGVRHEAKRALLNMLATGIRGAIDPTYEMLLRSLPTAGQGATIVGRKERADPLSRDVPQCAPAPTSTTSTTPICRP